jgi:hypothetical protein
VKKKFVVSEGGRGTGMGSVDHKQTAGNYHRRLLKMAIKKYIIPISERELLIKPFGYNNRERIRFLLNPG